MPQVLKTLNISIASYSIIPYKFQQDRVNLIIINMLVMKYQTPSISLQKVTITADSIVNGKICVEFESADANYIVIKAN